MRDSLWISGLQVHTGMESFSKASVRVSNGKIAEVSQSVPSDIKDRHLQFPNHYHLIPGRIDCHIHGVNGANVMDATPEALDTLRATVAREGVTGFMATTVTDAPSKIEKALTQICEYKKRPPGLKGAEILGIHLEGPFISPKQLGAHGVEWILLPDMALFDRWQRCAGGWIKLVTFAPELSQGMEFLRHLCERNVMPCIGHSDASFEIAEEAIASGARYATHLFNAMRGFHHREPGCVGAVLLDDRITAELILDGHHLHRAAVQFALQMKSIENLVLVTDAVCGHLGGRPVTTESGAARLSDGTLAGSVLTLSQAVKNLMTLTACDLSDAILLTSINPAKILNLLDKKGTIEPGKDADLVILNENYDVVCTICQGNIVFSNN